MPNSSSRRPFSSLPDSKGIVQTITKQYRLRAAADPDFARKSIAEVFLAAGTQLLAEANRRGGLPGLAREVDFVFAGVLTAVAGKYYSMWRVAPTVDKSDDDRNVYVVVTSVDDSGTAAVAAATAKGRKSFWPAEIPTNAFQTYLLDGRTRPTAMARVAALFVPIPTLFRAGVAASAIGYGLTGIIIRLRTWLLPKYVAQTVSVNIFHACLYTGGFMAIVSNLRYQILQGVIEPNVINKVLGRHSKAKAAAIFAVRYANGLLGSIMAIMGMKWMGLQKMKD